MHGFVRHWLLILGAAAFWSIAAGHAMAERRVALVVGNAKYEHADTLANTVNDANAVGALLTKVGFEVVDVRRDVGVVEFKRAIRDFLNAASDADIAVVFYSGHGFEIGGVNYLIPVDAKLASDFDVEDETIPLDRIIQATQTAKKLSLIILDACRDNPFLRAGARANASRAIASRLIGVEATGADTLIAYAAKAGSVSYDGAGPNSPFTTALVKYIAEPGLDIRIALGKVRDDVMASTGKRQEPFVYGSLGGGDISLVPAPAGSNPGVAGENAAIAADYAMAERVGTLQGWQAFLAAHESGYYAGLARAQLGKLASTVKPSPSAPSPTSEASAEASPQDVKHRPVDVVRGKEAAKPAAPQPDEVAALPPASPDQACKADAARLAQLRLNPDGEQVAKFARELACPSLRPQVQRLMESLGLEPAKEQPGVAHDAAPSAQPLDIAETCKREAADLALIRANPDRASALRFAHDLKCDDLRAQAARLLDSIGE